MKTTSLKLSRAEFSAGMGKMVNAKIIFLRQPLRAKTLVQAQAIGTELQPEMGQGDGKRCWGNPSLQPVLCSPTDACGLVAYPMCTSIFVSATGHQQCLPLTCGKESIQLCVKQRAHSLYSWHQLPGVTQRGLFPSSPTVVFKCYFLTTIAVLMSRKIPA